MKPSFIVILSFILSHLSGQGFAPNTSVWYYTYDPSPPIITGYLIVSVVGDTIIQGKTCKILKKTNIGYDFMKKENYNNFGGFEYVYSDSDKVYNFRFNKFYVLYNFGLESGSFWRIVGEDNSLARIIVDSVENTSINSIQLRVLYIHTDSGHFEFSGHKIIEKIGSEEYMFPIRNDITGPWPKGPLRCYFDDSFGLYKVTDRSCDYLPTSLNNILKTTSNISVIPNPVNSISSITWNNRICGGNNILLIYDSYGRLIKTESSYLSNIDINKTDFKAGLYFFRLINNNVQVGDGKFEIK